ncbi:hypothetical protein A3Q56_05259 [Intoshia linei]|uniref:MAGUK p55 subfamily member 5 n=1 Tax=Intoshia linei TaxID=1819745 RepID=A0A177AZV6_9BILA|nr:hypothetical protein A3Q56_05259 [Intoshia linei]
MNCKETPTATIVPLQKSLWSSVDRIDDLSAGFDQKDYKEILSEKCETFSSQQVVLQNETTHVTNKFKDVFQFKKSYSDHRSKKLQLLTEEEKKMQLLSIKKYKNYVEKRRKSKMSKTETEQSSLRNSERLRQLMKETNSSKRSKSKTEPKTNKPDIVESYINPSFRLNERFITTEHPLKKDDLGLKESEVYDFLKSLQQYVSSDDDRDEFCKLNLLVSTRSFKNALKLHNILSSFDNDKSKIFSHIFISDTNVFNLFSQCNTRSKDTVNRIQKSIKNFKIKHLFSAYNDCLNILQNSHCDYEELESENYVVDEIDTIKIIKINKSADYLGLTVSADDGSIIVSKIIKGGIADKIKLLRVGDEILEVNGVDLRGKTVNQVADFMDLYSGPLTMIVLPNSEVCNVNQMESESNLISVKSNFNYDPTDDIYNPCRELGISFNKGEILHIYSEKNTDWWQAFKEDEDAQPLAGLIPSASFHRRLEIAKYEIKRIEYQQELRSRWPCFGMACCIEPFMNNNGLADISDYSSHNRPYNQQNNQDTNPSSMTDLCRYLWLSLKINSRFYVQRWINTFAKSKIKKKNTFTRMNPVNEFFETAKSRLESKLQTAITNIPLKNIEDFSTCIELSMRRQLARSPAGIKYYDINVPYEQVVKYYPVPTERRPLILFGPHNIGRHEIRKTLIMKNPNKFGAAIPHTTRKIKNNEINGLDYHFIGKNKFWSLVNDNCFIEYGKFNKHYYGTTFSSVESVMKSNRNCVINLEEEAILRLYLSNLKPIMVLILPSSHKPNLREAYYKEENTSEINHHANFLKKNYYNFFEKVIINETAKSTVNELIDYVDKINNNPQWIVSHWVNSLSINKHVRY